MATNRELLEGLLKRVNGLAGTSGKLYRDNTGWYVINSVKRDGLMKFDESSRSAGELMAYLHGVEDTLKFTKGQ